MFDVLKPKAPSAREIELSLPALQEAVLALEQELAKSALDAYSGDTAAIDRQRKTKAKLAESHDALHMRNLALAGAVAREKAKLEASREAIKATQRAACKRHLASLAKDADALAASAAESVHLYQQAVDRAGKVLAAWPLGSAALPDDTGVAPGQLRAALMAELFRLSAPASGGSIGRNSLVMFPGASSPSVDYLDRPEAILPLAETVRQAIATTLALIDKAE